MSERPPEGSQQNYAMEHWNNKMCCVIDTETTGLDPNFHEIIQLCVLPVDSFFRPRRDISAFYVNIKPEYPERIDKKAAEVNKLDLAELMKTGFDRYKVLDMFEDWYNKLGIKLNAYGNPNKIMPLGQNYAFDRAFMQVLFGVEEYNRLFDYHYRDTMIGALYLNDQAGMHSERVPFPKVNLQYLATTLKVETTGAHNALADCLTTAEVYRLMCKRGLL